MLENKYLNMIKPRYNIRKSATTMKGYQHSYEAINKMKEYLKEYGHSMLGKKHSFETINKIIKSTTGSNNPMYGKKHTINTKELIRNKLERKVYLFNQNDQYINKIKSMSILAKILQNKTRVSKYVKSGKL
jgi:group I intron endonuclease